MRHTSATLARFEAAEHPKVVADRLGDSSIAITLNTCGHVTEALRSQTPRTWRLIFGA